MTPKDLKVSIFLKAGEEFADSPPDLVLPFSQVRDIPADAQEIVVHDNEYTTFFHILKLSPNFVEIYFPPITPNYVEECLVTFPEERRYSLESFKIETVNMLSVILFSVSLPKELVLHSTGAHLVVEGRRFFDWGKLYGFEGTFSLVKALLPLICQTLNVEFQDFRIQCQLNAGRSARDPIGSALEAFEQQGTIKTPKPQPLLKVDP
ncbi:MAG: hypothetical protein ACE5R6_17930 [Candidatus Heimdallarchaeota archaeon]